MGTNTCIATTDYENANKLSEYFCSVFTREPDDDIPEVNIHPSSEALHTTQITDLEITDILKFLKLNKSAGPDYLQTTVLVECAEEIAVPLRLIYQTSLDTGILLSIWKTASVTAVNKKRGGKKKTELSANQPNMCDL